MENLDKIYHGDVENISRMSIVPTILEVICRTTGLGFSAVARVTHEKWVACAVKDEIKFGLLPGGELKVDSTLCHEIHQTGKEIVIDHAEEDEYYRLHHTSMQYGFQSYISVPIFRADGSFWGTLCAIDPGPAILNTPAIRGLFKLYTQLISLHLHASEHMSAAEVKNMEDQTFAVLQNQLLAIKEQTDNGVNARKLSDRDNKRLNDTIERIIAELKNLLRDIGQPAEIK